APPRRTRERTSPPPDARSTGTRSSTRRPSFACGEHDRKREREGNECVEVIELHRQVERVRRKGAGERCGAPPRERADARRERVASCRQAPPERARSGEPAEHPQEEHREQRRPDE